MIENASRDDVPEILAIYNEVIRNSTAVYTDVELTEERGNAWFGAKVGSGFPFIVARDASGIAGFGSFGDFRAWPCYRHTVEHSVHVRADRRGRGIGRALVSRLVERADRMGKHVMVAGIDAENVASIAMHARLGFARVAHFHEVGRKF